MNNPYILIIFLCCFIILTACGGGKMDSEYDCPAECEAQVSGDSNDNTESRLQRNYDE